LKLKKETLKIINIKKADWLTLDQSKIKKQKSGFNHKKQLDHGSRKIKLKIIRKNNEQRQNSKKVQGSAKTMKEKKLKETRKTKKE
jgi:hypothetical protein